MSQGKVSDFFSTKKKRTADVNPSKRRKIDPTIQTSSTRASSRASSKLADSDKPLDVCLDGPVIDKFSSDSKNLFVFSAKKMEMANQQRSIRNSKAKSKPVKISSKNKPPKSDKFQMKLTELISASSKSSCQKEKDIDITSLSDKIQDDDNHIENGSVSMMTEEITSIDDDHDFTAKGLCTPRKRSVVEPDSSSIPKSLTRTKKLAPRRLSDENKERLVKKNHELSVSFSSENEATQKEKADVDVTLGTESSVLYAPEMVPINKHSHFEVQSAEAHAKTLVLCIIDCIQVFDIQYLMMQSPFK